MQYSEFFDEEAQFDDLQQLEISQIQRQHQLTLYQATYGYMEEKSQYLTKMRNPHLHTYRGQNTLCLLCEKSKSEHIHFDKNDFVLEYLERNQFGTCQICLEQSLMVVLNGQRHEICKPCFRQNLKVRIDSKQLNLSCPHCSMELPLDIIVKFTNDKSYKKYIQFMKNQQIASNPNCCWCPNTACDQVIEFKGQMRDQECPKCQTQICRQCKQKAHIGVDCADNIQQQLDQWQINHDTQQCPKCGFLVEKLQGCNHMTCYYCQHEWCWICGSDYTSIHFGIFNPFGCPALMPGWIRQKDWTLTKLMLWRMVCFLLTLILVPLIVLIIGPAFFVNQITSTRCFSYSGTLTKIGLVLSALIIGILITPITIIAFVILFIPGIIGLIVLYLHERQRLRLRHIQAMQRHSLSN